MHRVIVLAGAPDARTIDWATADLLDEYGPAVARFAGWPDRQTAEGREGEEGQDGQEGPRWRLLPNRDEAVVTGPLEDAKVFTVPASFVAASFTTQGSGSTAPSFQRPSTVPLSFATQPLSFEMPQALPGAGQAMTADGLPESPSDADTRSFLEHSLAAHHELPSSPLPDLSELWGGPNRADGTEVTRDAKMADYAAAETQAARTQDDGISTVLSAASLSPSSAAFPTASPPLPARWGPLTDLAAVPPAAHITAIVPQTATITAVVGIIAVAPPRSVSTRWGGASSLIEVVIGDETRAGFTVSFWEDDRYRETLSVCRRLRPGDVVLLRHVALHAFGERVYGSSLRRDQTKVHVLGQRGRDSRRDIGLGMDNAASVLVAKTRRVRAWVLQCVGAPDEDDSRPAWGRPPEDT